MLTASQLVVGVVGYLLICAVLLAVQALREAQQDVDLRVSEDVTYCEVCPWGDSPVLADDTCPHGQVLCSDHWDYCPDCFTNRFDPDYLIDPDLARKEDRER